MYRAVNLPVLDSVPASARDVLDVGCGTGAFGAELKRLRPVCRVTGITSSEPEAAEAVRVLDRVIVRDLDLLEPGEVEAVDCIVCSHVLEHLRAPERLLTLLRERAGPATTLVVALPNVLHWRQRLLFAAGRFRYTDGGIMDRTHLRFYDWTTARALLAATGWEIVRARASGTFPLSRLLRGVGRLLDGAATTLAPGVFGVEFVLVCRKPS